MIKDNLAYLVFLIPVVMAAFFLINSAQDAGEVANREQTTNGTLVAHQAWNHNRWEYRFQVDAHTYTGLDRLRSGTPKVGEPVTIFFDPLDPTTNALTSFKERRISLFGPAVAILLVGVGAALVVLFGGAVLRLLEKTRSA